MDRPGKCLICERSSFEQYCPTCSSIDYMEEEELKINWCKMCMDEIVPEGDKYCHWCIEDHEKMHEIGKCNPECIVCAKIDKEMKPDAYSIQVDLGRKR